MKKNDHLESISLGGCDTTDYDLKIFFKGATRNSNLMELNLLHNRFGVDIVKAVITFLSNSTNLTMFNTYGNEITTEVFDFIVKALQVCSIKSLCLRKSGPLNVFELEK